MRVRQRERAASEPEERLRRLSGNTTAKLTIAVAAMVLRALCNSTSN
jgi:hypothetical protein